MIRYLCLLLARYAASKTLQSGRYLNSARSVASLALAAHEQNAHDVQVSSSKEARKAKHGKLERHVDTVDTTCWPCCSCNGILQRLQISCRMELRQSLQQGHSSYTGHNVWVRRPCASWTSHTGPGPHSYAYKAVVHTWLGMEGCICPRLGLHLARPVCPKNVDVVD